MTLQITDGTPFLGSECPATLLSIKPTDLMQLHNGKYTMHLELDEETYWGLVKLGAEIKTDCETYAENLLIGCVQTELNQKTED